MCKNIAFKKNIAKNIFNIKPWFVLISIHIRVKVNVIYLSILFILRHFESCKLLKRDWGWLNFSPTFVH